MGEVYTLFAPQNDNLDKTLSALHGLKADFVGEKRQKLLDSEVALCVYEKYYFRNNSFASLSIQIIQTRSGQVANLISSAGGEGLLNISLGANGNLLRLGIDLLESLGFSRGI